jgi:YihY family inner membrane protein
VITADPGETPARKPAPKPAWTKRGIVQRSRDRHASVDFGFSTLDSFQRHRTGRNAALLAHYGFLSVFPLLLVLTTILGFVLHSQTHLRDRIINSTLANIPIIGQTMQRNPGELRGNAAVLSVGLVVILWAGTKAFVVAQIAINDIWELPDSERPNLARTRVRALLAIAVIGGAQIGAAIVTGVIGVSGVSWLNRILLALSAIIINVSVLAGSYRVLTARALRARQLLPGAIGAGLIFSALQVLGTTVVLRAITRAAPVYGTFASVIGLMTWMSLHALVALIGVEVNATLDRRARRSLTLAT